MDLEQLRTQWNNIDLPSEAVSARVREMEHTVRSTQVTTLRDKLYRTTLALVAFSFIGLVTMVPFASASPGVVIAAGAFFVMMGLLNFYRALNIRSIDITSMSVREALESVYKVQRQRVTCRAIGIACAIPLLIYLMMTFDDLLGEWAIYGGLIGILIGGCIGLLINHRTSTLLKEMKSRLED